MPNLITWQGAVTSVQYLTRDGRSYRPAKTIEKADILTFSMNGKIATLVKDKTMPLVNENDEVEATGVVNERSNGLEVVVLKNRTLNTEWKFSRARAIFGI